ncbi:MAG: PQQ-binding-like beta-propeller repeat protein [Microscillaceae bacterium]|jgi:outer membrane protein assembly factor BamB|nr:PQQ-binding-like beta-propeller repeat protein [Microscillaceae bacterium]
MKKSIFFWTLFIWLTQISAAQNISDVFRLKWRTYIGQTTYRTNLVFANNMLIVGSNGKSLDLSPSDNKDGVYLINPQNGKIMKQIRPQALGDEDVNGIAINQNKLFFGNDNGVFYAYHLNGKKIWEYALKKIGDSTAGKSGNVEACPALARLNEDAELDVVFTVRGIGIVALDGVTGKEIWRKNLTQHPGAFMNAPAIYDLNQDGIDEVVCAGWAGDSSSDDSFCYALQGKTGEMIWQYPLNSGVKASPLIVKRNGKIEILVAQTYSNVYYLSAEGKLLRYINLNEPEGGISGLYASPILNAHGDLVIGSSWWGDEDLVWLCPDAPTYWQKDDNAQLAYQTSQRVFVRTGRVTATALVGDILDNGNQQTIIGTEKGNLLILNEQNLTLYNLTLPAGVEATPLIRDVDDNGDLEILIATRDGYLYCYQTLSKGKVHWGQLRGNNQNTGLMELK